MARRTTQAFRKVRPPDRVTMQRRGRGVPPVTGGGKVPSFCGSEGGQGARAARMAA
jgi:hypothetical protein